MAAHGHARRREEQMGRGAGPHTGAPAGEKNKRAKEIERNACTAAPAGGKNKWADGRKPRSKEEGREGPGEGPDRDIEAGPVTGFRSRHGGSRTGEDAEVKTQGARRQDGDIPEGGARCRQSRTADPAQATKEGTKRGRSVHLPKTGNGLYGISASIRSGICGAGPPIIPRSAFSPCRLHTPISPTGRVAAAAATSPKERRP